MNAHNNNIDQIFRDTAQSQQAPAYNDAYWAEMSAMLDAKSNNRRALILWTFGGAAITISLIIVLFGINHQSISPKYIQAELQNNSIINIENIDIKQDRASFTTSKKTKVNASSGSSDSHNNIAIDNINKLVANSVVEINSPVKEKVGNSKIPDKDLNLLTQDEKSLTINDDINKLPILKQDYLKGNETGGLRYASSQLSPLNKFNFYAKFSGGVMENYKTSRPFESGLIDLSLNFEANLKNVLIRTGIGSQLTSNADLIVSQRAKVYDFGATDVQNDLSYQTLFDLYLPVEFGYRHRSTAFGIGIQLNYLMTTKMNLNRYENNELATSENIYGNTNGLNPFSTQGYVWMEQGLSSRFAVGLKIGTNISGRIKEGKYFNNSSTTNPIYGQISVRFNLTK